MDLNAEQCSVAANVLLESAYLSLPLLSLLILEKCQVVFGREVSALQSLSLLFLFAGNRERNTN